MVEQDQGPGYEDWDVSGRGAFLLYSGTVVVLLAILGGAYLYWRALFSPMPGLVPLEGEVPRPHLQVSAPHDRRELLQQQFGRLKSYGWVDRQAGIAHIPIGRAMELRAGKP